MTNLNPEELEKLNKELEETKVKLEALNHFKTHLLALTSHQFKAPLASIKGYATIVRQGLYGEVNEKIKEALERIEFAADDLVNLVNNVIDLRKVEEGRMDYDFVKTDFKKLAQDAAEGLHLLAIHKKLDFTFSAPEKELFVNADEQKLRHVVLNLVDNAIKYTEKGFIHVEIKEEGDKIVLSARDSGIGIAPGVKPLLFEEFVRDERVKREIRGTGIGLHIAKSIVEAHGGKIWAESEGEGKGSTFFVELEKA